MDNKRIFKVGIYRIELIVPNDGDLKNSSDNNISAYDDKGQFLWNISQLLKAYSENNGLKYYDDMYFDIKVLDNETVFCIGFINHCEIDLKSRSIKKLVNNR